MTKIARNDIETPRVVEEPAPAKASVTKTEETRPDPKEVHKLLCDNLKCIDVLTGHGYVNSSEFAGVRKSIEKELAYLEKIINGEIAV